MTARFSDNTGIPDLPDGVADANPHGMGIRYHLPDGSETDMVISSLAFFPVATGEEFRDLLQAVAASPPGAAKPTAIERFVAAHPSVPAALATIATPASFAGERYFGLNAFVLVDKAGTRRPVRFRMTPERLTRLVPEDAAARAPGFLMIEIQDRVGRGPVRFTLQAQLAAPGDPTSDASRPWPAARPLVELGTLIVDHIVQDSAAAEKQLLLRPSQLGDGIEPSDDPLIALRDGAHAASFPRRNP